MSHNDKCIADITSLCDRSARLLIDVIHKSAFTAFQKRRPNDPEDYVLDVTGFMTVQATINYVLTTLSRRWELDDDDCQLAGREIAATLVRLLRTSDDKRLNDALDMSDDQLFVSDEDEFNRRIEERHGTNN